VSAEAQLGALAVIVAVLGVLHGFLKRRARLQHRALLRAAQRKRLVPVSKDAGDSS